MKPSIASFAPYGQLVIAEKLANRAYERADLTKRDSLQLLELIREVKKWMDDQHAERLRQPSYD